MKKPIEKKKLVFGIISLVLVVVLIVAIVMNSNMKDLIIHQDSSGPDSIDVSNSFSENDSKNDSSASTNNQNKPVDNSISIPQTNTAVDDGRHVNDLNNTGKKPTLKNNCYSTGYPIADKPVTFNVMIKDYTNQANYNKMKINEFIAKKMNIKLNYTLVGQAEVTQKLLLAYSSGNMPDLFIGMAPYSISEQWEYVQQGLVLQLDDYIKQYAPNIQRLLKENPDAKYAITAEDGHYYSFPMLNQANKVLVFQGLYINQTWLDTLGLKMPTSTNSFMKVLNAFKSNDPNGNGKNDEIPLLLQAWNTTGILPGCLYGPFGLSVYGGFGDYSLDDNGKVRANYTTPNYKTALTYYRTLYKNGLIDKEWFGNSAEDFDAKLNTKTVTVGAFVAHNAYQHMPADRADDYVFVPAFRDKSVDKATWSITGIEYAWGEWFLVTKNCKYPEVAVRFADYFYSLEGTMTALQGPQGFNWNVKSDGTIYMTDNFYKAKYKSSDLTPGYPLPNYASQAYYNLVDKSNNKNISQIEKKSIQADKARVKTYSKAAPKNIWPSLIRYSNEVPKDDINELAEYAREMTVKFLNGSVDVNVFWDNYVSVCKSLGSEEYAKVYQKAYDRYVKTQKK
ncbi:MAG: hypothetical protein IKK24_03220 [Clostridia bacterium]|nr:hypothetical protein [Clostridia bacterium]